MGEFRVPIEMKKFKINDIFDRHSFRVLGKKITCKECGWMCIVSNTSGQMSEPTRSAIRHGREKHPEWEAEPGAFYSLPAFYDDRR